MWEDNRTDALRTDPPTDQPFNGKNGFRSDTRFLIMNHSNRTNLKNICSISQTESVSESQYSFFGLGWAYSMGAERCG